MSNDVDLYSDLPEETTINYVKEVESELATLQKKCNELQHTCTTYEQKLKNCEQELKNLKQQLKDYEILKKNHEILKKHSSSLFLTARNEVKRKDKTIYELRNKYDNLVFRRNVESEKNIKNENSRIKDVCEDNEVVSLKTKISVSAICGDVEHGSFNYKGRKRPTFSSPKMLSENKKEKK